MKLWPRSMAGQLAALLLAGLMAAHVVAILAFLGTAQVLNPVARDRGLERLSIAWRLLQRTAPADVPGVLETLSTDSGRLWIDAAPLDTRTPLSAEEERMLRTLATQLPEVPADALRVRLDVPPGGPFAAFEVELGWSILTMETAVRMPDGRWLHARQLPLAGYQWWRLLRFSLPTSTLPVLAIVLLFVWRMLRPIKALAEAAEHVSRGERIAPLRLFGPREVREVSSAFNLMQQKLTQFIDHRTQMLAAISHDFRTPITSLRLRAEMVEDPVQRTAMVRTLDEMRVMVEQTLQFTQDDAAVEATREIDLRVLLQQVEQEQQALGHDVVLAPGPAVAYRARPVSLKRAIANLVDNAVRHGGSARLGLVAEPGKGLCVTVDDEGPGLDTALLEQVFEPFFQLDQARNHQGGPGSVGLGLSIARSCVRAHGGDVTLANRAQGGLRATITLP